MKFTEVKKYKESKCGLLIDGYACKNPPVCRNFCRSCYTHLQRRGLLDKFGPPRKDRGYEYTVNKKAKPWMCRIKADRKACHELAHCRGLCNSHYNIFRPRADFNKFAAKKKVKGTDF